MKKVVIVEDNEMTLDIYKLIFKKYIRNVDIECIQEAEKAIERVTKNQFDLLIADFNLGHPTINGMDIARLAYPLGKPIMIVSGHKFKPRMNLYFRYWDMFSRVTFLGKPFKCKDMVDCVNLLLDEDPVPLNIMFNKIIHH